MTQAQTKITTGSSKVRNLQQLVLDFITMYLGDQEELDPVDLSIHLGVFIAENVGLAVEASREWVTSGRNPAYQKLPTTATGKGSSQLKL